MENSVDNSTSLKVKPKLKQWNKIRIPFILFLLTFVSTWLLWGPWYSIGIMLFLSTHEFAHYFTCKRYHINTTLPYFIPFPVPVLNPFGTFGAFIRIKEPIPNKKALFDIGASGPLAGFVITLPLIYLGLKLSTIVPTPEMDDMAFFLGEPLLFKGLSYIAIGIVPDGYDVSLHPLAYAGWVGLFVTALNLIPIGQLDGGHIFFSLFGHFNKKSNLVFLAGLGIMTIIYPVWIFFFILLLVFGRIHPPPVDNYTSIDQNRRLLGYIIFIIFIISFTPMPFKF